MNKTLIIAEAGVNHNGKISLAKKLIKEAKKAGADYVKFQTFITEDLVSKNLKKVKYQIIKKNKKESQFSMLKKLELSQSDFKTLYKYCKKINIKFLSTAFDIKSLHFVNSLNPDYLKIPSGEIDNLPLLKEMTKFKKKIILSTGMSSLKQIDRTFNFLRKNGVPASKITILHCNSDYPTPIKDVNLNVLKSFKTKFKTEVGYSDHTLGIEVSAVAVAIGAKIIEKHFTLNKNMSGPDHKISLNPFEFSMMVNSIRKTELALGQFIKKPSKRVIKNISLVKKSIVASTIIKIGEKFIKNNLIIKRAGNGISPIYWYKILGKLSKKNYKMDQLISKKEIS